MYSPDLEQIARDLKEVEAIKVHKQPPKGYVTNEERDRLQAETRRAKLQLVGSVLNIIKKPEIAEAFFDNEMIPAHKKAVLFDDYVNFGRSANDSFSMSVILVQSEGALPDVTAEVKQSANIRLQERPSKKPVDYSNELPTIVGNWHDSWLERLQAGMGKLVPDRTEPWSAKIDEQLGKGQWYSEPVDYLFLHGRFTSRFTPEDFLAKNYFDLFFRKVGSTVREIQENSRRGAMLASQASDSRDYIARLDRATAIVLNNPRPDYGPSFG